MSSITASKYSGKLIVSIYQAKDLKHVERFTNQQQPFCEIKCAEETFRTKIIHNASSSVQWNETFLFNLQSDNNHQDVLYFIVKSNGFISDTKVGMAAIQISELMKCLGQRKWIQLLRNHDFTEPAGCIEFCAKFEPSIPHIVSHFKFDNVVANSEMSCSVHFHNDSKFAIEQINPISVSKLMLLKNLEIVFLLDDSSSMQKGTLWNDLKQSIRIVLEINQLIDQGRSDVYFLNRDTVRNVQSIQDLASAFSDEPQGTSPLENKLRQIFHDKANIFSQDPERRLLVIIFGASAATNEEGDCNNHIKQSFRNCLCTMRPNHDNTYITFVNCGNEEDKIDYLMQWAQEIPKFQFVDNYCTKKSKIVKSECFYLDFTYEDYIAQFLVDSINI